MEKELVQKSQTATSQQDINPLASAAQVMGAVEPEPLSPAPQLTERGLSNALYIL